MVTRKIFTSIALLLLATVSWGAMFPAGKAVLQHIDPFYMTTVRYGITALVFLAILVTAENPRALRTEGRLLEVWLFGTAGFAGFSLLVFSGLRSTTPESGAMIAGLMPFMTVLVNWLLRGARPAAFTLGSIAVALAGVFLVVTHGEPERLLHGGSLGGDLMILLGVICWTVYTFGATRFGGWSTLRYTALSCALGSVSIVAITIVLTLTGISHVPGAAALAATAWPLGYIIVFCSVFAVLAWNSGIKSLGAVNGVLFVNLIPISAFLIGLAMGHTFTAADICGAGLTVLSLVANNLYVRMSQRTSLPAAHAASSMAKG